MTQQKVEIASIWEGERCIYTVMVVYGDHCICRSEAGLGDYDGSVGFRNDFMQTYMRRIS